MSANLYDTDFTGWAEEQSRLLRTAARDRVNLPLDWDHIAEEIESLGLSELRALRCHVRVAIAHMLKLECSTALDPRGGWQRTIVRARTEIAGRLKDEPSLRRRLPEIVADEWTAAGEIVKVDLTTYGEAPDRLDRRLAEGGYTVDQILGGWLPAEPAR